MKLKNVIVGKLWLQVIVILLCCHTWLGCSDDDPGEATTDTGVDEGQLDLGDAQPPEDMGDAALDADQDLVDVEDSTDADPADAEDPADLADLEDLVDAEDPTDASDADDINDASEVSTDQGVDAGGSSCPGSPICDTGLEHLAVEWRDTLYLCSEWSSDLELEVVLRRKYRIVMPPQDMADLFGPSLSAPFSSRVVVERGMFQGQRLHLESGEGQGTISRYQVEVGALTRLVAEIQRPLGEFGTLVQEFTIERGLHDGPLVIDRLDEVRIWVELPDGELVELIPCEDVWMTESQIEVLAAEHDGVQAVFLRMWGADSQSNWWDPATVPHFTPFRHAIVMGYWRIEGTGFWSSHHSVAADGSWEESLFESRADYLNASRAVSIREVHFVRGEPDDRPTIHVTTDSDVEEWVAHGDWAAVGNGYLAQRHAHRCEDLKVQTLSSYMGVTLQLIGCPADNAFEYDQVFVVPVEYSRAPAQIGVELGAAAFVDVGGSAGVRFDYDGGQLVVYRGGFTGWSYSARDELGEQLEGRVLWTSYETLPEVYEGDSHGARLVERSYESLDGEVRLEQVIFAAGIGTSGTTPYHAVSQELVWSGQSRYVDALDRLHYLTTHHNFNDTFTAEAEDIRFTWSIVRSGYDEPGTYRVSAERIEDGVEVLPETLIYSLD